MQIKITPDYRNKQIEVKLANVTWDMHKGIRTALYEIGAENTQLIKRYIYAPPKTGRYYPYKGRLHRASAPGESPAKMTGFLARSINYHVRGIYEVEVYSSASYANILEDGSPKGKIQPRPYFSRAFKAKQRDNKRSLERHVYDRLKK